MSDPEGCIRCNRNIDRNAKLCPYCTWDQAATPPPRVERPIVDEPQPHVGRASARLDGLKSVLRFDNRILFAIGGAALLVIIFVVGALVHGVEPNEAATQTVTAAANRPVPPPEPKANIELVPDNAQPITSAPAQTPTADGSMREDATALSSTDYAALSERAKTQPAQPQQPGIVDPRNVGTNAAPPWRQPDAPMASSAAPRRAMRTEPIPVYQPVPSLHVGESSARLYLTVGADGRVKDIDIARPIAGETPRLIAAVQNWRFRPATENGVPVAARFSVDITFHANE
jgi:hypothetical protein